MLAGAVDVAVIVAAIISSFLALVGTVYSVSRSSRATERSAAAASSAQAVEVTHEALVGTIHELRAELERQDEEHSRAMSAVRKDVERLGKEVAKCHTERDQLRRQLAKLGGS